ncbi:MAG TPA: alpha/beta fold hydrolase, partial [Aeromicrobium sp.]|nr:alpha/beta fold hydrolase [Aeromicrobium sp.]
MGLGGPMGWWDTEFCTELAERGFFVIRYDNRDTGRSTKLRHHRITRGDLVRAMAGRATAPYSLSDLADDAIGLLDELGIKSAHVVGVSMGGMIAQTLAIGHPERVRSLTSIMSTTGKRTVGWQHPRLLPTLLGSSGPGRDGYLASSQQSWRRIASPGFPTTPEKMLARAAETYDRGWAASGVLRHMMAVMTQPDRTLDLRNVKVPTTVIHGRNDPLVHRSGGRATARAIPGAEHVEIAGMGHDMPSQLWPTFIDAIVRTAKRAE